MKNLLHSVLRGAVALSSVVTATTSTFDANYDNLGTSGVVVPASLGTYEELAYTSFSIINNSSNIAGGIAPHSPPNFVGSTPNAGETPTITVVPPYKTFSMKSFWFGCDADLDQGAANQAVQCTITLAAFTKGNDQEVAVASFTFTPPENVLEAVPMIQAVLPSGFENVYNVTIIQNDAEVIEFGIDNLEYSVST